MADELSAWEEYDLTARAARPLPSRRSDIRRRSTIRVNEVDNLRFSKHFDSQFIVAEEETSEDKIAPIDLPQEKRKKARDLFSVFFEGAHHVESKSSPFLVYGTLPWIPGLIQRSIKPTFLRNCILFLELCLRGIGQVYFQNSPLSGCLILIGLFIQSPRIALHGVLGLVIGNWTAFGLGFANGLIENGLFGYNSVLVGLALATFAGEWSWAVAIAIIVTSAISSVLFVVMGKLLVPYASPPLTLPFNVATMLILVSSASSDRWSVNVRDPVLPDYAADSEIDISVSDVFEGSIRGIGQVFLADSIVSGIFILVGIAVCSPIAALISYAGSLLGCLWAWGAGSPGGLAAGLWGYNPSLCAAAMFMFYVPSFGTGILALLSLVAGVVAQQATIATLGPLGLPAMTLPFCVIALPLIILQGTTAKVISVPLATLTIPEDHLRRVRMLQEGFASLKDALAGTKGNQSPSAVSSKRLESLEFAMSERTIINEPKDAKSAAHLATYTTALQIFDHFEGDLKLNQFIGFLKGAGLAEEAGLQFAGHVFKLMDLDNSGTIDREEFAALALVSEALLGIHRDLAKFFDVVDADQSDSISFEELDAVGVYLGKEALTQDDRNALESLDECRAQDGDFDVAELINYVTVAHVKALVTAYHDKPSAPRKPLPSGPRKSEETNV